MKPKHELSGIVEFFLGCCLQKRELLCFSCASVIVSHARQLYAYLSVDDLMLAILALELRVETMSKVNVVTIPHSLSLSCIGLKDLC
jgi:hypothetical protein